MVEQCSTESHQHHVANPMHNVTLITEKVSDLLAVQLSHKFCIISLPCVHRDGQPLPYLQLTMPSTAVFKDHCDVYFDRYFSFQYIMLFKSQFSLIL